MYIEIILHLLLLKIIYLRVGGDFLLMGGRGKIHVYF